MVDTAHVLGNSRLQLLHCTHMYMNNCCGLYVTAAVYDNFCNIILCLEIKQIEATWSKADKLLPS